MANMKSVVSQDEILPMVRQILVGQDLSKITGKMVRERIIKQLGDRIQPNDLGAVKTAVKSALKVVLQQSANPAEPEAPAAPPPGEDHDTTKQLPTESTCDPVHPAAGTEPNREDLEEEESRANNPKSDSDFNDGHESKIRPPSKKRVRKVVRSDSESDSDSEPQLKPRRKKNPATSVQKRARSQPNSSEQRRLDKLKKVCRQLGAPVPPGKLRSTDPREKYDTIIQYLRSKGVREADPLKLSSRQISRHRERLAREKELEGLDVKNIIEEGGRSRRRASKPVKQLSDKLPSDLSGAELSEDSDSAESEGYAAPSDGSE